ncbi:EamA-like transporter family protein [Rosistilla carotiformis]|uniref:EamA-like transporter family protein n=1 Tax=Rosistilla carotiformis TaxID=2528017 RepID=A0A518JPJ1_9BACT|nr:DMT family transporter [Rosistilla carotiformis]QDV67466.1 EamA-like transporter family protein [Rosistilla carotiformis]
MSSTNETLSQPLETSEATVAAANAIPPQPIAAPISYTVGVIYCLLAAVGYTLANIALRQASDLDPILVTAAKAVPTMVGMAPGVFLLWNRGVVLAPQRSAIGYLIAGCLVGQFVGNCSFQYSLSIVGLALAVPITLGTMVIGGAIFGRIFLGERVTTRSVIAIVVLILATAILSLGSGRSAVRDDLTPLQIASGVIAVSISGLAFSFLGTMVRRSLLSGMAVATTMFVSGLIGTFGLSTIALMRVGPEGLAATTANQWLVMLAAGLFNLIAFFLLTVALQVVSVVVVNLLNVTQVAMAAIAGVLIFHERITQSMVIGVSLTIIGLMVLGKRKTPRTKPLVSESDEPT